MTGNIYITGTIGDFDNIKGVNLIDVVGQVKSQPEATEFNVYIDSEGGYVDIGFDIYNYLKSLQKPIHTIGRGMVASIATVIFMAGNKRSLAEGSKFMIHLPWGEAIGNADEVEQYAKELRDVEKQLLDFYKKALGLEEEALQPLLRDETWLTHEQLTTLGFLTSQPVQVVAKARINLNDNKMSKMTEEDKSWIETTFSKILAKFKGSVKNKLVQDATGAELDFGELADDAAIEVGATATIDGQPANGEYTMPDGTVYVFEAGELKEIREPESDDEMAAVQQENEELKAQLEEANTAKEAAEAETVEVKAKLKTVEKDVKELKAKVMSKFNVDGKKEGKKAEGDRTAGIKAYITEKRGK